MKQFIPFQFGISNQPLKPFDPDEKKAKKLEKLLKLAQSDLIVSICRHYVTHFIPLAVEHENEYWIMSCFPSTDHSPVRVSIWFPEVFNIHYGRQYFGNSEELGCMVFVHSDYLDGQAKASIIRKTEGLNFQPGYRFVTGITGQLAAFMPLESYFDFVKDDRVFEGIRAHNYELSLKGRTPFKKGHNYGFVRLLLGH